MTTATQDEVENWPHAHLVSLLVTKAFSIEEFRCPGRPELSSVERAPHPEIVLPRVGSYLRTDEAGEVFLDRTVLGFFEAGRSYSIRHFRPTPDLTTVISITDRSSLHDALGLKLPGGRAFARAAMQRPPDVVLLHRRLLRAIGAGPDGRLAAEEFGAHLILRVLSLNIEALEERTRAPAKSSSNDAYGYVHAVMQYLAGTYRMRVSLSDIAEAVGLSSFHLCRVFHAIAGKTIHQYLLSLRLEAAAVELLQSRASITEIAHGVGFASHAHFTALFTRTFGAPPRTLRKRGLISGARDHDDGRRQTCET